MNPDKHSAENSGEMVIHPVGSHSHNDRRPPREEAIRERDAIHLHRELTIFLTKQGDLNEQQAKRLRKSWELLASVLEGDSVLKAKLDEDFELLRNRIHQQVEIRNTQYAKLEQELETLKKSVAASDLKTSQLLEQKVIRGLNRISGLSTQRRQHILTNLETLQPKIQKLVSWRSWGTDQAREKIIEEIRHIHEKETDLAKIAKCIQRAREDWKQWDLSGDGRNHRLYTVFDTVCTQSYEPCKVHFDKRRKRRQEASRQRVRVCKSLEEWFEQTNWHQPNWKALQKLVREHKEQWRKLGPAEYRDRKPLAKRFDAILARFDEPLDRERTKNLKKRRDLIAKIENLKTMEDARQALGELQALKQEWQVTVSSKRDIEQAIWKQFTDACDAVHDRNKKSKEAFSRQLESHLEAKKQLCISIESLVTESPHDPGEVSSRLRQWQATWEKIGSVPKHQEKPIQKRFRNAMGAARRYLSELHQTTQCQITDHLLQRASVCAQLEKHVLNGNPPEVASLRAEFDSIPQLSEALQEALEFRFQTAARAAEDEDWCMQLQASLEENFTQINHYLLQLEINAGVDSPTTYAKQRMTLQISRLSVALGKGTDGELPNNKVLVERIHTTGAVSVAQQKEINQRFAASYRKLNSRQPPIRTS